MAEPAQRRMTYAEYLQLEADTGIKHEFLDGEVVAMVGGTVTHGALVARWIALVHQQLRGKPCFPTSSDVRVRTGTGLNTYPDVPVICGEIERAPDDRNAVLNPSVVIEVLSPSTETWDRGDKLRHYMSVPSLRDVVLCSQHEPAVWHYARIDDEAWTVRVFGPGDRLRLQGCEVEIVVDELYDGIELEQAPKRPGQQRSD